MYSVFSYLFLASTQYPVLSTQFLFKIVYSDYQIGGNFGDYFSSSRGFSPCTCTSDFEVSSAGGTFSSPSTASASSACPVSASSRTLSSESVGTSDKPSVPPACPASSGFASRSSGAAVSVASGSTSEGSGGPGGSSVTATASPACSVLPAASASAAATAAASKLAK